MPYIFNGCGTRYYGKQDKADDGSYVTTEWITFVWIPLIPLRSFRVLPFGEGTNYVIHSSQTYRTMRVPLRWSQVRNVYFIVAPIILLVLYFNRDDIANWFREEVLKSQNAHASLQVENVLSPVEPPLSSKGAAVACGKVLKLERPSFERLNLIPRLSAVVSTAGFTEQELKDFGPVKDLSDDMFSAYSFAYLMWDQPLDSSRAEFDKMIVKIANAQDLRPLSSAERAEFGVFMVKFKRAMLHSFELGRQDARMSPCPTSS